MKFILSLISVFLITLLTVDASLDFQELIYKNETLRITPQLDKTYLSEENITSVFRIQRMNATEQELNLNYIHQWKLNGSVISEHNINKVINKYTTAQTGYVEINQSGLFQLVFLLDEELLWNVSVNLSLKYDNVATEINQSFENHTDNQTVEEILNESADCEYNYSVQLNKKHFSVGEKITIDFELKPQAENFSITYWIEDIFGTYVKKPLTTTNTNTKTHTFKSFDSKRNLYFVRAEIQTCEDVSLEEFILVNNSNYEKEETVGETTKINYQKNSKIKVLSTKVVEKIGQEFFEIKLEIYKGDTSKSVVNIFLEAKDTKIMHQKIKIPKKYQEVETTLVFPLFNYESSNLYIEGLDELLVEEITSINKPKKEQVKESTLSIENIYTRQKYVQDNNTIYVRVKAEGEVLISIQNERVNSSELVEISGEQTIPLVLNDLNSNESFEVVVWQGNNTVRELFLLNLTEIEKKEISREEVNLSLIDTSLTAYVVKESVYENNNSKRAKYTFLGAVLVFLTIISTKYRFIIFNKFIKRSKL